MKCEESYLTHEKSGFILLPQIAEVRPLENGGVSTMTTIQVHQSKLVPDGAFEYQHSTGENLDDSFRKGFDTWVDTDLTPLLEALHPKPKICTTLVMEFPEKNGKPASVRRAILGPVIRWGQDSQPVPKKKTLQDEGKAQGERCEGHEFCPCCLLTNSFEAFRELVECTGFYGLRLLALRDQNGTPQSDCRVNGIDWVKGADALRKYVATWPEAGFEMRKQYVVVHTVNEEL